MAFRLALITLFVAALCSSSMGSSVYRLQRAAKPAAKASANAAPSPNANAAANPNANAAANADANAANSAVSPAQNQASQNQESQNQEQEQQQQQAPQPQSRFREIAYLQHQQPQGRAAFYGQQPYIEVSRFAPGQLRGVPYQPYQAYQQVNGAQFSQFGPPPVYVSQPSPAPVVVNQPAYVSQPSPARVAVNQQAQVQPAAAKSVIPPGAAPNNVPDQQAQLTGYSFDMDPADKSFSYAYQTNNGISQQAKGYINQNGNYVQEGSYTLFTPEGVPVSISYVADENGFQAVGDAIPQPDPIIAKAIAYQRSLPPSAESESEENKS